MDCTLTLWNIKTLISNWSQLRQLWTNQMVGWIGGRWEWSEGVTSPLQLGPQLPHFLFYWLYKNIQLYNKRGIIKGDLQYIQEKRELGSQKWELSSLILCIYFVSPFMFSFLKSCLYLVKLNKREQVGSCGPRCNGEVTPSLHSHLPFIHLTIWLVHS